MATSAGSIPISATFDSGSLERDVLAALNRIQSKSTLKLNSRGFTEPLGKISGLANEFQKSLEASNARVVAFGASAGIIYNIQKAFSALIDSTIQTEKSLTSINVVLNASSSTLNKFGNELFNIAKLTGSSFTEVADAATEFSRQGLSLEDTLKRTRDALILTRLSGLDVVSSTEALTSAVNSFTKEALTTTDVVNKLAAVDAKFAVSSRDLSEAIKRVGSSASEAGVGFDELLGIVTSVQQTTARGGAVIGNALKTIFTRIQRPEVINDLRDFGVAVQDASGKALPVVQVLENLASSFEKLNPVVKAQVGELVGGVFQINILKASLSDLSKENSIFEAATRASTLAIDDAIIKNEAYNKSISSLLNQTLVNFAQLGKNIGNVSVAPGIQKIIGQLNTYLEDINEKDGKSAGGKIASGLLKGITDFITGPGLFIGAAIFGKLFSRFGSFTTDAAKNLLGLNTLGQQQQVIQGEISKILSNNPALVGQILSGEKTRLEVEKQIRDILVEQSALARQIAETSVSSSANLTRGGLNVSEKGYIVRSAAKGYVPNFDASMVQEVTSARKLGARSSVTAQLSKGTIDGKRFVKNNDEIEIVKAGKNGDSAVIPMYGGGMKKALKMIKSGQTGSILGGVKNKSYSRGFVPNFAEVGIADFRQWILANQSEDARWLKNNDPGFIKRFSDPDYYTENPERATRLLKLQNDYNVVRNANPPYEITKLKQFIERGLSPQRAASQTIKAAKPIPKDIEDDPTFMAAVLIAKADLSRAKFTEQDPALQEAIKSLDESRANERISRSYGSYYEKYGLNELKRIGYPNAAPAESFNLYGTPGTTDVDALDLDSQTFFEFKSGKDVEDQRGDLNEKFINVRTREGNFEKLFRAKEGKEWQTVAQDNNLGSDKPWTKNQSKFDELFKTYGKDRKSWQNVLVSNEYNAAVKPGNKALYLNPAERAEPTVYLNKKFQRTLNEKGELIGTKGETFDDPFSQSGQTYPEFLTAESERVKSRSNFYGFETTEKYREFVAAKLQAEKLQLSLGDVSERQKLSQEIAAKRASAPVRPPINWVWDSDLISGERYKDKFEKLQTNILNDKEIIKDILLGPAGVGKTTYASKLGYTPITDKVLEDISINKRDRVLLLSSSELTKDNRLSNYLETILSASKLSGGTRYYANVPNEIIEQRRQQRFSEKGITRGLDAQLWTDEYKKLLESRNFTAVNLSKGFVPNFSTNTFAGIATKYGSEGYADKIRYFSLDNVLDYLTVDPNEINAAKTKEEKEKVIAKYISRLKFGKQKTSPAPISIGQTMVMKYGKKNTGEEAFYAVNVNRLNSSDSNKSLGFVPNFAPKPFDFKFSELGRISSQYVSPKFTEWLNTYLDTDKLGPEGLQRLATINNNIGAFTKTLENPDARGGIALKGRSGFISRQNSSVKAATFINNLRRSLPGFLPGSLPSISYNQGFVPNFASQNAIEAMREMIARAEGSTDPRLINEANVAKEKLKKLTGSESGMDFLNNISDIDVPELDLKSQLNSVRVAYTDNKGEMRRSAAPLTSLEEIIQALRSKRHREVSILGAGLPGIKERLAALGITDPEYTVYGGYQYFPLMKNKFAGFVPNFAHPNVELSEERQRMVLNLLKEDYSRPLQDIADNLNAAYPNRKEKFTKNQVRKIFGQLRRSFEQRKIKSPISTGAMERLKMISEGFIPNFASRKNNKIIQEDLGSGRIRLSTINGSTLTYRSDSENPEIEFEYVASNKRGEGALLVETLGSIGKRLNKPIKATEYLPQTDDIDRSIKEGNPPSSIEEVVALAFKQLRWGELGSAKNTLLTLTSDHEEYPIENKRVYTAVVRKLSELFRGDSDQLLQQIQKGNISIKDIKTTYNKGFIPNFAEETSPLMFHGTARESFKFPREKQTGIWFAFDENKAQPGSGDRRVQLISANIDKGSYPIKLTEEEHSKWAYSRNPLKWIRDFRFTHWRKNPNGSSEPPSSIEIPGYALVVFSDKQINNAKQVNSDSELIKFSPPKNKKLAKGYVPNFSDSLQHAISREVAAGYSPSQVKVGFSPSLVTDFNPSGAGVFNSTEGSLPAAMQLAKNAGIDVKTKGMSGTSAGHIPNFAEFDKFDTAILIASLAALGDRIRSVSEAIKNSKDSIAQNNKALAAEKDSIKKASIEKIKANAEAVKNERAASADRVKVLNDLINAEKGKVSAFTVEEAKAGKTGLYSSEIKASEDKIKEAQAKITQEQTILSESKNKEKQERKDIIKSAREDIATREAETARLNSRRTRFGNFVTQQGLGIGLAVAGGANIAGQFMREENFKGRALASGIGDIASYAGTGAAFGPMGAAVGGVLGLASAAKKLYESKAEEALFNINKELDVLKDKGNIFGNAAQGYVSSLEQLQAALNDPKTRPDTLVRFQTSIRDFLYQIPDEFKQRVLNAGSDISKISEAIAKVNVELNKSQESLQAQANILELISQNKTFFGLGDVVLNPKKQEQLNRLFTRNINQNQVVEQFKTQGNFENFIKDIQDQLFETITSSVPTTDYESDFAAGPIGESASTTAQVINKQNLPQIRVQLEQAKIFYGDVASAFEEAAKSGTIESIKNLVDAINKTGVSAFKTKEEFKLLTAIQEDNTKKNRENALQLKNLNDAYNNLNIQISQQILTEKERASTIRRINQIQAEGQISIQRARTKGALDQFSPFITEQQKLDVQNELDLNDIVAKQNSEIRNAVNKTLDSFTNAITAQAEKITSQYLSEVSDQTLSENDITQQRNRFQRNLQQLTPLIQKGFVDIAQGGNITDIQQKLIQGINSLGLKTEEANALISKLQGDSSQLVNEIALIAAQGDIDKRIQEAQKEYQRKNLELTQRLSFAGGAQALANTGGVGISQLYDSISDLVSELRKTGAVGTVSERGSSAFKLLDVLTNQLQLNRNNGLNNAQVSADLTPITATAIAGRVDQLRKTIDLSRRVTEIQLGKSTKGTALGAAFDTANEGAIQTALDQIVAEFKLQNMGSYLDVLQKEAALLNVLTKEQNKILEKLLPESLNDSFRTVITEQVGTKLDSLTRALADTVNTLASTTKSQVLNTEIRNLLPLTNVADRETILKSIKDKLTTFDVPTVLTEPNSPSIPEAEDPNASKRKIFIENEIKTLKQLQESRRLLTLNNITESGSLQYTTTGYMGNTEGVTSPELMIENYRQRLDDAKKIQKDTFDRYGTATNDEIQRLLTGYQNQLNSLIKPKQNNRPQLNAYEVFAQEANKNFSLPDDKQMTSETVRLIVEKLKEAQMTSPLMSSGPKRENLPSNQYSNSLFYFPQSQTEPKNYVEELSNQSVRTPTVVSLSEPSDELKSAQEAVEEARKATTSINVRVEAMRNGFDNLGNLTTRINELLSDTNLDAKKQEELLALQVDLRKQLIERETKNAEYLYDLYYNKSYGETFFREERAAQANKLIEEKARSGIVDMGAIVRSGTAYNQADFAKDSGETLKIFVSDFKSGIGGAFSDAIKGVKNLRQAFADFFESLLNRLTDRAVNQLVDVAFGAAEKGFASYTKKGSSGGLMTSSGFVRGYNSGGLVAGGSGVRDDVLTMMNGGEFVIRKSSVNKYGSGFLEQLNQGTVPTRAAGGGSFTLGPLQNEFVYNDPERPTSGEYQVDPRLSAFALTDENNPQNKLREDRFEQLDRYLIDRAQFERDKQKALSDYEAKVKGIFTQGLITAGIQLASAGAQAGVSSIKTPSAATGYTQAQYESFGVPTGYGTSGGIIGKASGGSIGKDNVPALLMGGEYVMNQQAVRTYGTNFMNQLNNGNLPKFADGGLVPNIDGSLTAINKNTSQTNYSNETLQDLLVAINNLTDTLSKDSRVSQSESGATTGLTRNTSENAGMSIVNNISVNVTPSETTSSVETNNTNNAGQNNNQLQNNTRLGELLRNKVVEVIAEQKRPGGLLYGP